VALVKQNYQYQLLAIQMKNIGIGPKKLMKVCAKKAVMNKIILA